MNDDGPTVASGDGHASRPDTPAVPFDVAGETTIDAQRVVTGRGVILGKSDSGKSNTATVVAEELLSLGVPIAIIDPEGEYVALREDYPIVHFGDDPSADVTGGVDELRRLAERAVAESLPVVVDLTGWAEEQQQELAGAFASALYRAEHRYETPMPLFVDECHDFIPERAKPASATPLIRVAKRGRKRGLGFLGITQRPADAASAVLTQADWFGWHRLSWNNDVDRVKQHLDSEYVPEVTHLDAGEMLLARDWRQGVTRVQVRKKTVTDLGATPSITRSLGTVPNRLPDDLGDEDPADTSHDSDRALDATMSAGDPIATYRVIKADARNSKLCALRRRLLRTIDVSAGDSVSVTISDGEIVLSPGDHGIGPYTVCETNDSIEVALYAAVLDMLDADPGDHVRGFDHPDGIALEATEGTDAPLLARSTPYCGKTENDRADSVLFSAPVGQYLGLSPDERVSVVEGDDDRVYLIAGDADGGHSYVVTGSEKPVVTVGARGCSLLGVRDGHEVIAKPADGYVRLQTRGDRGV